jgi:hypothetical protein
MKVYVIQELGFEYDDENWSRPHIDGEVGTPVGAYRTRANADARCAAMNAERVREEQGAGDRAVLDYEGKPFEAYYRVVEVELTEEGEEGEAGGSPAALPSYAEARGAIKKARELARAVLKDALLAGAREFFEKYPDVGEFSWVQYTPHWNDGDPCRFGIQQACIDGNDEYGTPAHEAVEELIAGFDETDLQAAYGDGFKVTVKRDLSIDVRDYDHD